MNKARNNAKTQLVKSMLLLMLWAMLGAVVPFARGAVVVNFDTLPDGASGAVLSNYLAGFGITISGMTTGVTLQTQTNRTAWAYQASSPPAYLVWGGRNDVWQTFTLNFSTPLSSLSFTRCAEFPVNGGTAFPEWSATVYEGAAVVGTAGQSAHSIFSPNSNPAQTYNFTGTGITSVTFSANTANFAGVGSPAIDDIIMTPAPTAPATLDIHMYAGLTITGTVGASYEIQYTTSLTGTNWQHLTDITLTTSPYLYVDTTSPATGQRFYRALLK